MLRVNRALCKGTKAHTYTPPLDLQTERESPPNRKDFAFLGSFLEPLQKWAELPLCSFVLRSTDLDRLTAA